MNRVKLIEKIEGEAKLNFSFDSSGIIDFVEIEFFSSRGIEKILENRPALDALVINPRVCGICGHAHLIATVKALESCYESIEISPKAKILRELTLNFELIQNHFKWFYLNILPLFGYRESISKALKPSQLMAKSIATIAGQYPHTSYAIVGGVVCEPTVMDMMRVKSYINETMKCFNDSVVLSSSFSICQSIDELLKKSGDLPTLLKDIKDRDWQKIGRSYDRFIVFGSNSYFKRGKSIKTNLSQNVTIDRVREFDNIDSKAKNVLYKDRYYEVGSLSRAMVNKIPLIKDAHRRFGDSILSRIVARVCEIPQLLKHSLELIDSIDLNQESYITPPIDISDITANGVSAVEAARGSLIHKVSLEDGIISKYEIITPTQWNLSNGSREYPGIAQKAMIGVDSVELAEIIFKSFDVCSVCTTH